MAGNKMLREYVLDVKEPEYIAPEDQVRIVVSLLSSEDEVQMTNTRNFPNTLSVAQFKDKLQLIVGCEPEFMEIEIQNTEAESQHFLSKLDDEKTLIDLEIKNNYKVNIKDTDPNSLVASLNDLSTEDTHYKMSNEDYDNRETTYKKWKEGSIYPDNLKLDSKCKIKPDSKFPNERIGEIKFIGETEFAKGFWVGIKLDEKLGKNDGSVKGKRYFSAEDGYGCFVRANQVVQGLAL